jgi:molecular chaperone Hsp33
LPGALEPRVRKVIRPYLDVVTAFDDLVIPFSIVGGGVSGRIVRLGSMITDVIARHNYPSPVNRLLGEAVALTALLGVGLKFDGRFILQANSDGPVDLLVVEYETSGMMRAYAHFDTARLPEDSHASGVQLLGKGTLGMTIDQGSEMERYQGVVSLEGQDIADAAHTYFNQSEQIPTRLHLGAGEIAIPPFDGLSPSWRAGGVLIQKLPSEGIVDTSLDEEDWDRARHLVNTVSSDELLDPMLSPEDLLYRLFHEDGVRVSPPTLLRDCCHCSHERVSVLLRGFSPEEITEMIKNNKIIVTCEFCSTIYEFDPEKFLKYID